MNQKEFEDRLDEYAEKISAAVSDGINKIETAFESAKENLKSEKSFTESVKGVSGSPKMGLILVVLGILWLLHSIGVFSQPVFPVLLIILGVYFLIRNR